MVNVYRLGMDAVIFLTGGIFISGVVYKSWLIVLGAIALMLIILVNEYEVKSKR